MGFLYLIHNLNWGHDLENSKRNSRTAIIGFFCYIALHVLLNQCRVSFGMYTDGLLSGLFLVLLADVSVMAYTYRNYYGRGILNELNANDDDQAGWVYDETTHKYRRPTSEDIAKAEEEKASKARTQQIRETKSKIRAAVFIQRWWRDKLYTPPKGILYLRAEEDWKDKIRVYPTSISSCACRENKDLR